LQVRCERRGQLEVGVLDHEGRVFAAFGAGVHGHNVTTYTRKEGDRVALTSWCDKVILACRSEVVRAYPDGSLALMFRLTHGRYIVGYALGERGSLFRGELLLGCDDGRARRVALDVSEYWAAIDAEAEADPWHEAGLVDGGSESAGW
jgi:hypothetical protein